MNEPACPLRVAVAEDERDTLEFFRDLLTRLGHDVVVLASTGRELVRRCREAAPDLIITDVKMPDLDGIAAAEQVNAERPVPVVLVTAYTEAGLLARAVAAAPVMAYLVKPVKACELAAAARLAVARFGERQQALRALEERKLVERAKGALMKRLGVDEDEAHRRLGKYANDNNVKVTEVAGLVLRAEEVFGALDGRTRP
jgi:two-component system, response regulator PdtaR